MAMEHTPLIIRKHRNKTYLGKYKNTFREDLVKIIKQFTGDGNLPKSLTNYYYYFFMNLLLNLSQVPLSQNLKTATAPLAKENKPLFKKIPIKIPHRRKYLFIIDSLF